MIQLSYTQNIQCQHELCVYLQTRISYIFDHASVNSRRSFPQGTVGHSRTLSGGTSANFAWLRVGYLPTQGDPELFTCTWFLTQNPNITKIWRISAETQADWKKKWLIVEAFNSLCFFDFMHAFVALFIKPGSYKRKSTYFLVI